MAIAFVQSVHAAAGSATSVTTAGITTTSGNFVAVNSGLFTSTTFTSITDSKGNTWTQAAISAASQGVRQHYAENITGGASHTFTLTNTIDFPVVSAQEFSGVALTGSLDQTATGTETGTAHSTSATSTTAQADEVLIGAGAFGSGNAGTVTTSGWTTDVAQNNGATEGLVAGHRIVSATGTYTFDWTTASSTVGVSVIGTYKAAAAGSVSYRKLSLLGAGR